MKSARHARPGTPFVIVAAAAALTACAAVPTAVDASDPNASASTAVSPQATPSPGGTSPTTALVDAKPAQDASAAEATMAIATDAVTRFCRPLLDYDTWITELYPLLSQTAAIAYETVDPANVPCTVLAGDARVRDGDEAYTMRIWVPTDAGEYSVYVHRTSNVTPWAVEQITPPDGQ